MSESSVYVGAWTNWSTMPSFTYSTVMLIMNPYRSRPSSGRNRNLISNVRDSAYRVPRHFYILDWEPTMGHHMLYYPPTSFHIRSSSCCPPSAPSSLTSGAYRHSLPVAPYQNILFLEIWFTGAVLEKYGGWHLFVARHHCQWRSTCAIKHLRAATL
jgi:hypothetical protein